MGTEVITLKNGSEEWPQYQTELTYLTLEKVGGHDLATVAIEEGEGSAESGSRNTPEDGLCDDTPPAGLGGVDSLNPCKCIAIESASMTYPC